MNNYRSNAQPKGHAPKAPAGSEAYQTDVAQPVMAAVDEMPSDMRACANEFGFVGVWLAWKRDGKTAAQIRQAVANGTFEYND